MERKEQIIESLLAKPTKKPDFTSFKGSDVLKRAQMFIPQFISTTDRLLSDPELLKRSQMDIKVQDQDDLQLDEENCDNTQQEQDRNLIEMDIGVGMYDVLNENFDEKSFKPSSSVPIIRVQGMEQSSSSDDDASDDSNLYYEFNSDTDHGEAASSTTQSTNLQNKKQPMIVDITPMQDVSHQLHSHQKQEELKTLNVKSKKSNNKKRKRRAQ